MPPLAEPNPSLRQAPHLLASRPRPFPRSIVRPGQGPRRLGLPHEPGTDTSPQVVHTHPTRCLTKLPYSSQVAQ